jgi:hypothetical protein
VFDIDPQDIDPETGRPYANYSSPALDTSFHDAEMDDDDSYPGKCSDGTYNHHWNSPGERDRCYCMSCGADGDA